MIIGTLIQIACAIMLLVISSKPKAYYQRRLRSRFAGTKCTVKLVHDAFWLVVDSGEMLRISENCQGLEAGQQVVISNVQLATTFEVEPVLKAS